MKYRFLAIVLIYLSLLIKLDGQDISDEKSMIFSVMNINALHVHNHTGTVTINGTSAQEGTIHIRRTLKSASKASLERGKESIYFDSMRHEGTLYFFVHSPDRLFRINEDGNGYYQNSWNRWNGEDRDRFDVKSEFSIEVQVPSKTNLYASTHEKDLHISNMAGKVSAHNHHDDVTLLRMQNDIEAHSHHGNIQVQFDKNPLHSIICHTHHGDIKIKVQDHINADVKMKSHHGSFFTDLDYKVMATQVSSTKEKRGTKYTIGDGTNVRMGQGGLQMDFRTHHGDVYITKN